MGRQAYLNWAVGKLVNDPKATGGTSEDVLDGVESEMRASGGPECVEKLQGVV